MLWIPRLLQLGAALVGVFWLAIAGGWAMRQYDELRATPSYTVRVLFLHWTLKAPIAPAYVEGESDPASPFALALARCNVNVDTLEAGLARQDRAIRALAAAGDRARVEAEAAIARSRAAIAAAKGDAARILAAGADTGRGYCPRYEAVDAAFLRSLP